MSDLIESLTPKQETEMVQFLERYMAVGWSTGRSDRARAERGMVALYKLRDLKPPKFVWVNSPFQAVKVIADSTGSPANLSGTDGSLDAYWLSFYMFCIHIGGKVSDADREHLKAWEDIIESTGPCFPYEKVCIMTERPSIASHDERGMLHSVDGPSLAYLDGEKLFHINGVAVPEMVVMEPWKMTLAHIQNVGNDDVQSIMQDRWCHERTDSTGRNVGAGGGRWLEETAAKTIAMDLYTAYTDEETGDSVQIQRALIEDKQGRKYLMCSDSSTDRIYYIRVAPESMTCEEGHRSINGGIPDSKIVVSS
jgi:hypothetical protein